MNNKETLLSLHDFNAKAMWKKKKNVVHKDKTKYTRKIKHKKIDY